MLREVTVCDRCQDGSVDRIATRKCCICSKDYCEYHANLVSVTISLPSIGMHSEFVVCPDCKDLLAFDNFTTGEESTRAAEFDRSIIRLILPDAIAVVKQSLTDIYHQVGPDDVREWVSKQKR